VLHKDVSISRWTRLWSAFVGMVMIGNLQYAWTLFAEPIVKAHSQQHWHLSQVQWGFGLFIAAGCWAMPFFASSIDHKGPRELMALSGLLCAVGWGSLGHVQNLIVFYLLFALAGVGVACVYGCGVATSVKWFPDRRGMASGIITAGYGMGAALFNPLFNHLIHTIGYANTLLWTGITHGALILLSGLLLANPPADYKVVMQIKKNLKVHHEDFTPSEMLRTPDFYFLFVALLSVGIGGLMATAQLKPVATNFGIAGAALTATLILTPLANGFSRILWGWVSDHMGRAQTMSVAFLLLSIFLVGVTTLGRTSSVLFVVLIVLVFLTWGELYVLFPTTLADLYGSKYSATNYSLLYSAKGFAALSGGGLAATLFEKTGSWNPAFFASAAFALLAAILAVIIHKLPLPHKAQQPTPGVQPTVAPTRAA
jgi:MFS transporter, OFA family, oxalate/formate antiporter